jgi:hypothetical protein
VSAPAVWPCAACGMPAPDQLSPAFGDWLVLDESDAVVICPRCHAGVRELVLRNIEKTIVKMCLRGEAPWPSFDSEAPPAPRDEG